MTLAEFDRRLTELYPKSLSAEWDNDGIMVSENTDAEVKRVLVALDATAETIEYAAENGFDTVLVHHPMIFGGQKSITQHTFGGNRIIKALKNGVSVISMHTRLDAGKDGVNDTLIRKIGFEPCGVLDDSEMPGIGRIAEFEPMTAAELAVRIKEKLGCGAVRLTGEGEKTVHRMGVCSGSGGDLLWEAILAGCDVFLTGECGYNKCEDAVEEGMVTITAGHFETENPICERLAFLARDIACAECEIFNSCPSTVIL